MEAPQQSYYGISKTGMNQCAMLGYDQMQNNESDDDDMVNFSSLNKLPINASMS